MSDAPNAHQAAVDTAIADATDKYMQAQQQVAWYEVRSGYEAKLEELRPARDAAYAALVEAERQYEGWSRFFIVHGGHIHSSMRCHSCSFATQFGWLPNLSGLTEAEAVAEWGGILCTFCFPSAPTEWTEGVNKKDADRKMAGAALRQLMKSPEAKAVKTKRELVRRHQYRLGEADRRLRRFAQYDPAMDPDWVVSQGTEADAAKPKIQKALAKAEAALEAAELALAVALGECPRCADWLPHPADTSLSKAGCPTCNP